MDRLRSRRLRKRVEVRYGLEEPDLTGFTGNLSASGLMIRTMRVFGRGTLLNVELVMPEGVIRARARVMWAREGSLTLISTGRIGMGLKFIETPAALQGLLEEAIAS